MQITITDHQWMYKTPSIQVETQVLGTNEIAIIALFADKIKDLRSELEKAFNAAK